MADRFNEIGIDDFPGDPARDFRPCSHPFRSVRGDDYDLEPPYGALEDREDYEARLDSMAKNTTEQSSYPIGPVLNKAPIGSSDKGDLINEFSWSVTRDRKFHNCHREYYYCYYGSWGGWDKTADPEVRELYIMKNLRTRPMWVGSVVHDFAERIVKTRGRQPADLILKTLRMRMEADWHISETGRFRLRPNRTVGLAEHYYGLPITPDDFEEDFSQAKRCIRTLYTCSLFQEIISNPSIHIMECEQLGSFYISGLKVWVKIDLAAQNGPQGIEIIDWKTGRTSKTAETLRQLAVYGLYATFQHQIPAENITIREVRLTNEQIQSYRVDEDLLVDVQNYILRSAQEMNALLTEPEENVAFEEDFDTTADYGRCFRCNFRRTCGRNNNDFNKEEANHVSNVSH